MTTILSRYFDWIDTYHTNRRAGFVYQFFPVAVCLFLFCFFIFASVLIIERIINPASQEKILFELHVTDILVGFFLYFVTAVDYALVVGRMSIRNPGSRARLAMNVFTCVGCFVGVSLVLLLWGFAKEVPGIILPLLIFAGSVMVKLAYEGREYFEHSTSIWSWVRSLTMIILKVLYYPTRIFTYWIPELSSPKVESLSVRKLAVWSFVLPFIIGLDDFIGYMGAMTIYNVFSLLIGIYLADIFIDILIFISPALTRKVVENAILSLLAAYAFLYLAYKSFSESILIAEESYHFTWEQLGVTIGGFILIVAIADLAISRLKKHSNNTLPSTYPIL